MDRDFRDSDWMIKRDMEFRDIDWGIKRAREFKDRDWEIVSLHVCRKHGHMI